jgi:hypothetical protein
MKRAGNFLGRPIKSDVHIRSWLSNCHSPKWANYLEISLIIAKKAAMPCPDLLHPY